MLFQDKLNDQFGTWPLAYIPYGGADFGEIAAIAEVISDADVTAFYEAWTNSGSRLSQQAEEALKNGHVRSARELFLRASAFYASSYHPLYGEPLDPRLLKAFHSQVDALNLGLSLFHPAIAPVRISFEQTSMPAYLVPAEGYECAVRPLIIFTNGLRRNHHRYVLRISRGSVTTWLPLPVVRRTWAG